MIRAPWSRSSDTVCSISPAVPERIARCGSSSCSGERTGQLLQSIVESSEQTSGRCVNVSGLAPNLPGWKQILRLNCDRNSDHLACCLVSFLVEVKYSKFLWSITVLMAAADPSKKCRQDLNALNIAKSSLSCMS